MSFALPYYLLVEPKPALMERVLAQISDPDFVDLLLERVAICKTYVRGHGEDDFHIAATKLAYLSKLRVNCVWDTSTQFEELFGSPQLSVELFDRWWTLSELAQELFEDLETFVGDAAPLIAPQPDRGVRTWLNELRRTGFPPP